MTDLTPRERVERIQLELLAGDVLPDRARQMLMQLTALLGNCSEEVTRADAAYTKRLAMYLDAEHKANRARIRAEQSPEYQARQGARNLHELCVELIRSLKVNLRSLDEEMRLAR